MFPEGGGGWGEGKPFGRPKQVIFFVMHGINKADVEDIFVITLF